MSPNRTRTPSDVKWLANELAVLAGQMAKIDDQVALLQERRTKLESTRAALARVAELMGMPGLPGQVPAVRPFLPFGTRGALRNFIRNELRDAYPTPVDTVSLAATAAERFELHFASSAEFNLFRNRQVLRTLQKLVDLNEVERLHERRIGVNALGLWRLKVDQPSVLSLLALDANNVSQAGGEAWP